MYEKLNFEVELAPCEDGVWLASSRHLRVTAFGSSEEEAINGVRRLIKGEMLFRTLHWKNSEWFRVWEALAYGH